MTRGAADARDARIVVEWITGRHTSFRRAVFCARGSSLPDGVVSLDADDVVFAPDDARVVTAAHVIRYSGDFDDIGDTLYVAGHAVELQHYASAGYVELVGPTAVRILDVDGWQAFLADADLARSGGVFTSPMTDPRLRLADVEVFTAPFTETAPVSFHLRGEEVALGAQGATVGALDDLDRALTEPRPRWAALAGIVEPSDLIGDLNARPWLARYAGAARLSNVLGLAPSDRIHGFGWSLLGDSYTPTTAPADDPFLVRTSTDILLVSPVSRRRQRLSEAAAVVVATLHASVDLSDAVTRLASSLGVTSARAHALCTEAEERLGVHPGVSGTTPEVVIGGEA